MKHIVIPPELPQQIRERLNRIYRVEKHPSCPMITMREGAALLLYIESIEAEIAFLKARERGAALIPDQT